MMAILRISSFHFFRMFGLREKIFYKRPFIFFSFLFIASLVFILGFRNGMKQLVVTQKQTKLEYHLFENPGSGRKLQLSPAKTVPTPDAASWKVPSSKIQSNAISNNLIKDEPIAKDQPKIISESRVTFEDENEFILDVHEEDIKKVKPKTMNKTLAKQLAGANRPPPSVQRSLFSFTSLRHSMTSIKNPMHYGAALTKTRMALEMGEQAQDISEYKPPKTISTSIGDSEKMLAKSKVALESAPNYYLGDSIPAKHARHILVITSWRSGSTFLADILNHYPGTFYSFEPLHYLSRLYHSGNDSQTMEDEIKSNLAKDAIDLMSNVYKCNFDKGSMGYLSHVAQPAHQFLFKHNFRLWNICSTLLPANSACFMPEFYRATCPLFPIRLIKTVRLRVPFIEDLLKDPEISPNLKIVMLARDPRGVMTSRSAMTWCENPHCSNPEIACNDLDKDLNAAASLKAQYPDKISLIRYEDLSLDPFTTTDSLLEFLELKPSKLIEQFLESHTKTQRPGAKQEETTMPSQSSATTPPPNTENPYSTSRNSKLTAFAWKSKIDFQYLQHIQSLCYKPMEKLGYNLIKEQKERDDLEFQVLSKSARDISQIDFNSQL